MIKMRDGRGQSQSTETLQGRGTGERSKRTLRSDGRAGKCSHLCSRSGSDLFDISILTAVSEVWWWSVAQFKAHTNVVWCRVAAAFNSNACVGVDGRDTYSAEGGAGDELGKDHFV